MLTELENIDNLDQYFSNNNPNITIVNINKFSLVIDRTPCIIEKIFTSNEIKFCKKRSSPVSCLSMYYAAKVSLRKYFNKVYEDVPRFNNIEIYQDKNKYYVKIFKSKNVSTIVDNIAISLTYTKSNAVAVLQNITSSVNKTDNDRNNGTVIYKNDVDCCFKNIKDIVNV